MLVEVIVLTRVVRPVVDEAETATGVAVRVSKRMSIVLLTGKKSNERWETFNKNQPSISQCVQKGRESERERDDDGGRVAREGGEQSQ